MTEAEDKKRREEADIAMAAHITLGGNPLQPWQVGMIRVARDRGAPIQSETAKAVLRKLDRDVK
jgi:hypothetical protein